MDLFSAGFGAGFVILIGAVAYFMYRFGEKGYFKKKPKQDAKP